MIYGYIRWTVEIEADRLQIKLPLHRHIAFMGTP